jgi:predicted adenine nucleotide alpha hydrolase (AANH) superfamily ATPase
MELIYFILGFLFTVTGYGIVLLHKTKSSHTSLLEELNEYKDISSYQFELTADKSTELEKKLQEVSEYYNKIQIQMENDAYEGNTKLNDRITELAELFNEQGNKNKRLFDVADKQLIQNQREIQQANSTLKKIVDDPTILARY